MANIKTKLGSDANKGHDLPGVGAVIVEDVELLARDELAAVDARLDGPKAAQDSNLFNIAHHGRDVQSLQLGVHGVEAAHQVLQEEFKRLREADQLATVHVEGGDLGSAVVDQLAHVVLRAAGDGWRGAVGHFMQLAQDVVPVAQHGAVHGGEPGCPRHHGGWRRWLRATMAEGGRATSLCR